VRPYYGAGGVTLYHADCRDVLPGLGDASVDLVLTDPPYGEKTHKGARTRKNVSATGDAATLIDFATIALDDVRDVIGQCARVSRRWFVATMEWRHCCTFEDDTPTGWKFVRFGVWTKPDGAPQFTGDRPAAGWEAVAIMHRDVKGKMRWNGGGRPAVWHYGVNRAAEYPTTKPLPLIREFVSLFADPGGLILDPFCVSGTTLVAAADRGHPAIGCDISERACEVAAKRLDALTRQGALFGGVA
jgi:site-specific DNA-methyltransferase (adenine-specific)